MSARNRIRTGQYSAGASSAPPEAKVDPGSAKQEQEVERANVRERGGAATAEAPAEAMAHAGAGVRGEWFRSSDQTGSTFLRGATFGAKRVEYSVVDGIRMLEGDIALGPVDDLSADVLVDQPEAATARGITVDGIGITGEQFRWPRGRVPFEIDAGVTQATRTVIQNAIQHWHDNTNIRLVPRATTDQNFVRFIAGNGCWSFVGMRGGMQEISIGAGCGFGAAVHEIGHAVGLWHEQSREDRDQHVRIRWQNIQAGREHNFNQHIADGDDIGNYDFASIMHYGAFAFSKNGQATIETINGEPIGQRDRLSAFDIAAVRALYPLLQPPPQTTRLFRYWNPRTADHFYTTNWNELGGGSQGYVYEGVQCYIHPAPATGSTPLFRYWNSRITDHFYTTNWNELRAGASGWVLEGIQGYVYASRVAGTIPLYRYWNARAGDHFYTTSWGELGSGAHGWVYEGIQCYAYALPPADADEQLEVERQSALTSRLGSLFPDLGGGDGSGMGAGPGGESMGLVAPTEYRSSSFELETAPTTPGGAGGQTPESAAGRAVTIRIDLDRG